MSANADEYVVHVPAGFGGAIREFRLQRELSQEELAARADIHRSYLSKIESGSSTEAMRQIMRALDALDLELLVRPRRPPRARPATAPRTQRQGRS